jgi:hypothetical protein
MSSANVIGEGTFGCIHSPSLRCKDNNDIDYKNKISKVLENDEAKIEWEEYENISKIDKDNKYYIGKPTICEFDQNSISNIDSLNKCKNKRFKNPNNLSLIIMEDGGDNLDTFTKKMAKLNVNNETIRIIELFLIKFHNVFMGLQNFSNNDIVHHDLKPQNLVYKDKINFIDFGLMTTKTTIKRRSNQSINSQAVFHWSYPLEMDFYNRSEYEIYSNYSLEQKRQFIDKQINNLKGNARSAIDILLDYIFNKNDYDKFLTEYFETLRNCYNGDTDYDTFLNTSIDSIDIYGTGIACMVFYKLNNKFITSNELKRDLYDLFYQMIRPDFYKRIKIDDLINQYEHILEKHNILSKYNKRFVHHELVDETIENSRIKSIVKSINKKSLKITAKEREQNYTSVYHNPCKDHQEWDEETGRCYKKCNAGQIRNENTKRCNKIKPTKKNQNSSFRLSRSFRRLSRPPIRPPSKQNSSFRLSRPPIRPPSKQNKTKNKNNKIKCKDDQEFIEKIGKCYKKCNANQTRNTTTYRCNKNK